MTRTNWVAAHGREGEADPDRSGELGGASEDYDIDAEHVVSKSDPARPSECPSRTAPRRRSTLGGAYDGHETPEDINPMTQAAVAAIAGTGLIGVAKDNLPKEGTVPALSASFIEIELDLETGKYEILDYLGVADCGKVMHPMGLAAQVRGGAVMGFGLATTERHMSTIPAYGRPCARGLYQAKPKSMLDVPAEMAWDAVDQRLIRKTRSARRASASRWRARRHRHCSARSPMRLAGISSIACPWSPT